MKKSILNLGKAINKANQKQINGGAPDPHCDIFQGEPCYSSIPLQCKHVCKPII